MTSIFGSKDAAAKDSIYRIFRASLSDPSDSAVRFAGNTLIERIVDLGRVKELGAYDYDEDETVQLVMNAFAQYKQEHDESTSLFWESFFGLVESLEQPPDDAGVAKSLEGLMRGTPLVGQRCTSTWSFYSCFSNKDATALFRWIQANEEAQAAFEHESAFEWMDRVSARGADLWVFVS